MLAHGRRGTTRLAWSLWAITILLLLVSATFRVIDWSVARPRNFWSALFLASGFALYLTYPAVGALISSRQPRNPIGWLLLAVGLVLGISNLAGSYALRGLVVAPGSLPGALAMAWLQSWVPFIWFPAMVAALFVLFPNGRPPSARWWIVIWMGVLAGLDEAAFRVLSPTPLDAMNAVSAILSKHNPTGIGSPQLLGVLQIINILIPASIIGAIAALIVRFRRSSGDERQQLKWLVYVGALLVIVVLVQATTIRIAPPVAALAFNIFVLLYGVAIPVAMGIAILKYRLYDIDTIINKSLVYGALALFISTIYVLIVVGLGALIGMRGQPSFGLSIVATAVVAVAFQPLRERLQRVVNRLVYGERATAYEVIADFSNRMAGTVSLDEILPSIAEAARNGVGATQARVRLVLTDGSERLEARPAGSSSSRTDMLVPIVYRRDRLGEIGVAKSGSESLTPAECKLLNDLASQAGLVLHNVRLAAELKQRLDEISAQADAIRVSRQRIVAAQDTEQQRLERTIHQGTETQLAGIKAGLQQAEERLGNDPGSAATLLEQLTARAIETLENLRDVARGIYPPLLRERGLVAALQAQAEKMRVPAAIHANGLDRYPSEAESAIYFACVEALRSATGTAAIDMAATDGSLEFRVKALKLDLDGRQQDIEDRIEALGGNVVFDNAELRGRITLGVPERVA